jgi:hypothetical protein
MTFEKFSQLWDEAGLNVQHPITDDTLVMEGMSENASRAFITYANGDTSYIDEAKRKLAEARAKEKIEAPIRRQRLIDQIQAKKDPTDICYSAEEEGLTPVKLPSPISANAVMAQ